MIAPAASNNRVAVYGEIAFGLLSLNRAYEYLERIQTKTSTDAHKHSYKPYDYRKYLDTILQNFDKMLGLQRGPQQTSAYEREFNTSVERIKDFLKLVRDVFHPSPSSTISPLLVKVEYDLAVLTAFAEGKYLPDQTLNQIVTQAYQATVQGAIKEFRPTPQRTVQIPLTGVEKILIEVTTILGNGIADSLLDKQQSSRILSSLQQWLEYMIQKAKEQVARVEIGVGKPLPPNARPVVLSNALESAGAYVRLTQLDQERKEKDPTRRARLLQTYLTTETTTTGLKAVSGLNQSRNNDLLQSAMQDAFPLLPETEREQYGSPVEALRTRSRMQTETSIERIKTGMAELKDPDTGKITAISNAVSDRWRRYRAEKGQTGNNITQ